MSVSIVPSGMTRRHFLAHLAASSALAVPAMTFAQALRANAADLKKRHKAAIMLWMGGGPATIDIWDLKPGAPTGGPFQPIGTSGAEQICEHLPLVAKQMHHLAIVRSMSTREADHNRGRYYMHTGYVPNPNVEHPGYGSVISHMLAEQTKQLGLEIPPFVAVGGLYVVEEWQNICEHRGNVLAMLPQAEIIDTLGPSGGVEPLVVLRKAR